MRDLPPKDSTREETVDAGAKGDAAGRPRKPTRFPCFDGLRAFAALSVVMIHTAWTSGFTDRSSLGIYTSRLEIGVSVFFLISGFLLYRPFAVSHLSDRPAPSVGKFWIRRFLRIVPAYWLALTVLTYVLHDVSLGSGWQGVAAHYGFLQIYIPDQSFDGITQAWSLCTEVSFYLFLPLYAVVIGFRRASPRWQLTRELIGLAVLVGVSFRFRDWALHQPFLCWNHCLTAPALGPLMVDWLPSYLDLFALGMFLAVMSAWFSNRQHEPKWLGQRWVPWASWLCAGVAFYAVSHMGIPRSPLYFLTPPQNLLRQTLYGTFAFFLLIPAVFGPQDRGVIRRLLRCWPVASLGVISYGIYLWHIGWIDQVMHWTGWKQLDVPLWMLLLPVLGLTIVSATISYFGFERPILRLKDKIGWW